MTDTGEWQRLTQIGAQGEAIATLKNEVQALRAEIAEIKEMISATKGGIRMLILVGSAALSIGAGIVELLHWLGRHA